MEPQEQWDTFMEMKRLRADNERLREGRDTMGNLWARAKEEIAELRAENDRLRAALKPFAGDTHFSAADVRAARAALNETEKR